MNSGHIRREMGKYSLHGSYGIWFSRFIPSLKLTLLNLKMDGCKTIVIFWHGNFGKSSHPIGASGFSDVTIPPMAQRDSPSHHPPRTGDSPWQLASRWGDGRGTNLKTLGIHGTGIFSYMKTIKINHSCR